MEAFRLEPARAPDASRIAEMSRRFIEHGLAPSWPESRVMAHMRHRETVTLVARRNPEVLGFALMQFGEERAHLNLLAVAPGHRRRGVARALMAWLEETAVTAGTFEISLELRAGNAAAFAFYAALGYHEVRRIEGYYQGREQAIRMSRNLALTTPLES